MAVSQGLLACRLCCLGPLTISHRGCGPLETVGERNYGVAHGVWSEVLTVDWSGEAAEALRTDTQADLGDGEVVTAWPRNHQGWRQQ
jgi:hypothetical protein